MEMASATHNSQRGSQRINSTKTVESSLFSQKYGLDINTFLRRKPPEKTDDFMIIPVYCGFGTFVELPPTLRTCVASYPTSCHGRMNAMWMACGRDVNAWGSPESHI